jgi:hypothetical protein
LIIKKMGKTKSAGVLKNPVKLRPVMRAAKIRQYSVGTNVMLQAINQITMFACDNRKQKEAVFPLLRYGGAAVCWEHCQDGEYHKHVLFRSSPGRKKTLRRAVGHALGRAVLPSHCDHKTEESRKLLKKAHEELNAWAEDWLLRTPPDHQVAQYHTFEEAVGRIFDTDVMKKLICDLGHPKSD